MTERQRQGRKKLEKLYNETHKSKSARGGAYYDERNGIYRKYDYHSSLKRCVKKLCNKRIRRYLKNTDISANGNQYRKMSEYWWAID